MRHIRAVTPSQGHDTESFKTQHGYDSVKSISRTDSRTLTNQTGGKLVPRRNRNDLHPKTDFCSPSSVTHGNSSRGACKENAPNFFDAPKNQAKLSGRNRGNTEIIVESQNQLHEILN